MKDAGFDDATELTKKLHSPRKKTESVNIPEVLNPFQFQKTCRHGQAAKS